MAVNSSKVSSALVLKVKTGTDKDGKDIIKNIALRKVKTLANDQDIFDVAQGIALVIAGSINGIQRQDVNVLISGL